MKYIKCYSLLALVGMGLLVAGCQQNQASNPSTASSAQVQPTSSSQGQAQMNYQILEQNVQGPKGNLYGQLYMPESKENVPLVIFSHELGNTHETGQAYAEFLAGQGIATYIFDYAGGSTRSQSEGSTQEMSVLTEVDDLEAVIQASQDWQGINTDKITLLGASQGGVVSALTAARHQNQIAGLVLLYPAFVIQDEIASAYNSRSEIASRPNYLGWFPMGRRYAEDVWGMDFYQEIGNFNKPVLLMHGNRDSLAPARYSERAAQTYDNASYHEIDGAGHSFLDSSFSEVSNYILNYLKENQLANSK